MNRIQSAIFPSILLFLGMLAVIPLAGAINKPFLIATIAATGCTCLAVCGIDIILGVGHQFLLGQAAFFGVGAYSYAILGRDTELPILLIIVLSVMITMAIGALVGWVFFKLGSLLFAVGTLAVGVIGLNAMGRLTSVTGGADGMTVPSLELFGHNLGRGNARLIFTAVVLCIVVALTRYYISSLRGKRLRLVGADPVVAGSLGIDVRATKIEAMIIATGLAALGGVLFAATNVIIAPSTFSLEISILVVVAVVLGGPGRVIGPVIALMILNSLPELIDSLSGYFDLLIGILLVIGIAALGERGLNLTGLFGSRKRTDDDADSDAAIASAGASAGSGQSSDQSVHAQANGAIADPTQSTSSAPTTQSSPTDSGSVAVGSQHVEGARN